MDLGERKLHILQAIIDNYIISAEPVGSRTVAKKFDIGISSATIRNEMADLEEMGYLEQPHTSAGRVPSDKGYRLYVDRLMKSKGLSPAEADYIKNLYDEKARQIEQIIFQTSKIISDITDYTTFILGPQLDQVLIKHIQLVPMGNNCALLVIVTNAGTIKDSIITIPDSISEDDLYRFSNMLNEMYRDQCLGSISLRPLIKVRESMAQNQEFFNSLVDVLTDSIEIKGSRELYLGGTTNIFKFPEYRDIVKAKEFLDLMEQKDLLYKLLAHFKGNGVSVTIGEENQYRELQDYSIVTTAYSVGGHVLGTLGIIGPTRMEYSKAVSVMDFMGKTLSRYLTQLFVKE
ncbi:MAG: heat-inducible transcription repressor HrcA [Clostridiales bacterium]|nr:heat-inducible transcription repressor HrcA [Clostridiales bacterium]